MASEPPPVPSSPPAPAVARPRYLVVALVAALVFGAAGWTEGCARLQVYRATTSSSSGGEALGLGGVLHDDQERAHVEALAKASSDAEDRARDRGIPIAAATFVLGAALLALASRGLAGKTNARAAIMQVVAVQAVVAVTQFFVMREAREAELDFALGATLAQLHETRGPEAYKFWAPIYRGLRDYGRPTWVVMRVVASGLILVALTRQRSRQFFDAAADAAPDA